MFHLVLSIFVWLIVIPFSGFLCTLIQWFSTGGLRSTFESQKTIFQKYNSTIRVANKQRLSTTALICATMPLKNLWKQLVVRTRQMKFCSAYILRTPVKKYLYVTLNHLQSSNTCLASEWQLRAFFERESKHSLFFTSFLKRNLNWKNIGCGEKVKGWSQLLSKIKEKIMWSCYIKTDPGFDNKIQF